VGGRTRKLITKRRRKKGSKRTQGPVWTRNVKGGGERDTLPKEFHSKLSTNLGENTLLSKQQVRIISPGHKTNPTAFSSQDQRKSLVNGREKNT